jgi:RimJ/RimL family protein N-acetyltransferase
MTFRLELATGRARLHVLPHHVLRPAIPDDAPRLVAMFERCSPASRYARFLAPLQHFPASHLVDVVRSSAIRRSWVVDDFATGHVVGVGSWFRNQGDTAEVGLLVEDAFQRQGLGSALLDALVDSARYRGITTLVAETLTDSRHVHRLLRRFGPLEIHGTGYTRTVHVPLTEPTRGHVRISVATPDRAQERIAFDRERLPA